MTNYSRLHRMTRDDLAEELKRISKSELLPDVDFAEWLASSDKQLRPRGKECSVMIYARVNGKLTAIRTARVIVMSDNERFFGRRHYKLYDVDTHKIQFLDFELLEVIDW